MYQRRKIRNKLIHILDVTNVTIGFTQGSITNGNGVFTKLHVLPKGQ